MTLVDTHVEVESSRLVKARNRLHSDRWSITHTRPGCAADSGHLGYVPGISYRSWSGDVVVCVGYSTDGQVWFVDAGGELRSHRTRLHRNDDAIADTWTRVR